MVAKLLQTEPTWHRASIGAGLWIIKNYIK
jgi:hypothetical protein